MATSFFYSSVPRGRGARPVPPTGLLVAINGAAFMGFVIFATGVGDVFSALAMVLMLPFFVVGSAVYQLLLWWVVERRFFLAPLVRAVAYTLPIWGLVVLGAVTPEEPEKRNQISPTVSPSGRYEARVSTDSAVWVVEFRRVGEERGWVGRMRYGARFNAYWAWDGEDRLWMYNSDDASVDYWERRDGDWVPVHWGYGDKPVNDRSEELSPPAALWPEYAL